MDKGLGRRVVSCNLRLELTLACFKAMHFDHHGHGWATIRNGRDELPKLAPDLGQFTLGDRDVRALAHAQAIDLGIEDFGKGWTCSVKVESFLPMKGELDEQAEGFYAGV